MTDSQAGTSRTSMTGTELRAWREHWELSQLELARALGVVLNTVGRWERGERDVPSFLPLALETLERRIAGVLRQKADHAERALIISGNHPGPVKPAA